MFSLWFFPFLPLIFDYRIALHLSPFSALQGSFLAFHPDQSETEAEVRILKREWDSEKGDVKGNISDYNHNFELLNIFFSFFGRVDHCLGTALG